MCRAAPGQGMTQLRCQQCQWCCQWGTWVDENHQQVLPGRLGITADPNTFISPMLTPGWNHEPHLVCLEFEMVWQVPSRGIPRAIHQSISWHTLEHLLCAGHLLGSRRGRTWLTWLWSWPPLESQWVSQMGVFLQRPPGLGRRLLQKSQELASVTVKGGYVGMLAGAGTALGEAS